VIVDAHPKEFILYQTVLLTGLDKSLLHLQFCGYYNYDWKNYIYGFPVIPLTIRKFYNIYGWFNNIYGYLQFYFITIHAFITFVLLL